MEVWHTMIHSSWIYWIWGGVFTYAHTMSLVVKSKYQYARLLSTWLCWELRFSDSPSPCNFRLELDHGKAVCVLGGRREAAVIIFWRLSYWMQGCCWGRLLFPPSRCWPYQRWLQVSIRHFADNSEVVAMKSQQPSIDFVAPHAGFQSSLQVLTHLELSPCLQQQFLDLYLPTIV